MFKGSVNEYIRDGKKGYSSTREKLKTKPESLNDLKKIVPVQQEMYYILKNYYKKKGLKSN